MKLMLALLLASACGARPNDPLTRTAEPGTALSLAGVMSRALKCDPALLSWSIQEGDEGGSVTQDGTYTAPACGSPFIDGTVTVVVTGCGAAAYMPIAITERVLMVKIPFAVEVVNGAECLAAAADVNPGGNAQFYAAVFYTCHAAYDPPLPANWPPPPCP